MTNRKVAGAHIPVNPLRFARRRAGLSQADLAAASGVCLNTVSRLDRGDADCYLLSTARALALALGRTIEEIFPDISDFTLRG